MADTFNLGAAGPSGVHAGGLSWTSQSSNYPASANDGVLADTTSSAWTLTLPASPSIGTTVAVMDSRGGFQANNLTVSPNGSWIMGYGADLTCSKALLSFTLVYSGSYMGWSIYPSYPSVLTTLGATRGYRCGGNNGPTATTDRTTFSTDTTAARTSANLSTGRMQATGITGSLAGYILGGLTTTPNTVVNTTDKLTYSSEVSAASTTARPSFARASAAGVSDGYSKGYSLGGYTNNASPDGFATADKVTFSNDTTSAQTSANLSQARAFPVGMDAGPSKGYALGGVTNNGSVVVSTVDKVTYSSDTTAVSTSATCTYLWPAVCSGRLKGFMLGGATSSFTTSAFKITYSTDTSASATTANIATAKYSPYGFADRADGKGFILGGYTGVYVNTATAEKLTFSTETTASATTANLSLVTAQSANLTDQPAVSWV